jgi:hypothetical protein
MEGETTAEKVTHDAPQSVRNVRYVLGLGIAGAVICFLATGFVAAQGWLGNLW